LGQST